MPSFMVIWNAIGGFHANLTKIYLLFCFFQIVRVTTFVNFVVRYHVHTLITKLVINADHLISSPQIRSQLYVIWNSTLRSTSVNEFDYWLKSSYRTPLNVISHSLPYMRLLLYMTWSDTTAVDVGFTTMSSGQIGTRWALCYSGIDFQSADQCSAGTKSYSFLYIMENQYSLKKHYKVTILIGISAAPPL